MAAGTIPNLRGGPLEPRDFATLEARWITREVADEALLRRCDDTLGAETIGQTRRAGSDYSGLLLPYLWPGESHVRAYRLRRDHPDLEQTAHGVRKRRKYLGAPGAGNVLYIPPGVEPALLGRQDIPIVLVEGEFKTLALWRLAWHELGDTAEDPRFVPIGLAGVYSWRGSVGKTSDEHGLRRDVRGPIIDLSRIDWRGRRVIICFDCNVETDISISAARQQLTRELEDRGGEIAHFRWPKDTPESVNGIDDYLAIVDAPPVLQLLAKAKVVTRRKPGTVEEMPAVPKAAWTRDFIYTSDGSPKALLANAIHALRHAPEWKNVLAYNEFSLQTTALAPTPWGHTGDWLEVCDLRAAEWLQREGIHISAAIAGQAVEAVAHLRSFHPVRDYLNGLGWDGEERIDKWASTYLGCANTDYSRAVGAKWLISGIARVMEPGCQADYCLILEGTQGIRKSSALRVMGVNWFSDDIGDLHDKDTKLQVHGAWIIELSELDALRRSDMSMVKAFMTRRVDRFRPPYGHRTGNFPRQCIFSGSTNQNTYLNDDTGARRFWPITCGNIDLDALTRDRDQLWAEAFRHYRDGGTWWIEDEQLAKAAAEQQADRFEAGPWDDEIARWLEDPWELPGERFNREGTKIGRLTLGERFDIEGKPAGVFDSDVNHVTVQDILTHCLTIPLERRQSAMNQVARYLKHRKWARVRLPERDGRRPWGYRNPKAPCPT